MACNGFKVLTADPFLKFVEYILGDRVFGIQIPTSEGSQQRIKPDWAIILSYEQKLRKEAMRRVLEGTHWLTPWPQ